MVRYRILIVGLILLGFACTTTVVDPDFQRVGYTYFPVDSSLYRAYEVVDIAIPLVGEPDTQRFNLLERIGPILNQTTGDTTWQLERYTRADSTQDWRLDSLWQIRKTASHGVVVENNIPRLKLVFPLEEGKRWDGNALALSASDEYFMERVGLPYTLDGQTYETTVTVVQSNLRDTLEQQDFVQEIYAAGIGLILRESRQFRYCNEDSCFGQGIVEFGRSYRQVLLEYGE